MRIEKLMALIAACTSQYERGFISYSDYVTKLVNHVGQYAQHQKIQIDERDAQ